jgi:prophage regulatory protein
VTQRILSIGDLAERGIKYSRSQIYRKIRDLSFPQPVRLGGNRIGFIEAEIDAWIDALIAERDTTPPRRAPRQAATAESAA